MPWRISPTTSTLRYSSQLAMDPSHVWTWGLAVRLRASEMTFVSRRKLIAVASACLLLIKLHPPSRLPGAVDLKRGKVRSGQEEFLEIGLLADQSAILVDANHDRHLLTTPGDDLRPVVMRLPYDFAETLLRFLELPMHHAPPSPADLLSRQSRRRPSALLLRRGTRRTPKFSSGTSACPSVRFG